MKALMSAAASLLAIAGAAVAAPEATFDLRLDQRNGERAISVANDKTGAYAVAAGGAALDLLEGDEAKAAFERLRARPDIDIDLDGDEADPERDAKGKRKIIIHKMDYDEAETVGGDQREVRIIKRTTRDAEPADDAGAEDAPEAEDDLEIDLLDDGDASTARRVIFITDADKNSAAKFIDKIKGLDDAEKAAMKEAVGL
ncbi:MAG: hypothetical protein A3E78_15420 [Alphaproteobacteria bacterium RIFCSPHIGHO2_12_FULL_63_12]|nr:MAG: hypothetical protein A3E78_15420 [Alphaproteobacteria bacterium RIFCSPHIGHO2_12_FULL_63_12]